MSWSVTLGRAHDGRWDTRLGMFVSQVGVERVAAVAAVTESTVYAWVRARHGIGLDHALAVRSLAVSVGFPLTFEDLIRRQILALENRTAKGGRRRL